MSPCDFRVRFHVVVTISFFSAMASAAVQAYFPVCSFFFFFFDSIETIVTVVK